MFNRTLISILWVVVAFIVFTIFFYFFVAPISVDPVRAVPTPEGPPAQIGFLLP